MSQPLLVRCAPGLSKIMLKELQFHKISHKSARTFTLHQRNHDLLFLPKTENGAKLKLLRIAEDAHDAVGWGGSNVTAGILARTAEALQKDRDGIQLLITVDGKHFNRQDVQRFLAREMEKRGVRIDDEGKAKLWGFFIDDKFYLGHQRMESAQAPARKARVAEREGSLPPTVAAAMAFSANLQPGETLCDPACGSGTLLAEAYAYQPKLALQGRDSDAEAIAAARKNLKGAPVKLQCGSGAQTGLDEGSVDVTLCDLPFGNKATNADLYETLFAEMRRVAKPKSWRGIILTADSAAFERAMQRNAALEYTTHFSVKIRGESAKAYKVSLR